jgi:hypothetical protein
MSRKRKGKRRKSHPASLNRPLRWTGTLWLVLVDDAPLREEAAAQCRRRFQRLKVAREEWHRFERHDQPAFERWRAATFGPQLTELREAKDRLAALDRLITEVETEAFFMNCSRKIAYQRIMARRLVTAEHGNDAHFSDDDREHHSEDDFTGEIDDLTKEEMFWDFLSEEMQTDPDEIPDPVYAALFEQFKTMYFEPSASDETPPPRPGFAFDDVATAAPASLPARLKDLYRQLVRRLHPDARNNAGPETMHLWHEVQEAYATGDVERMEMLQALTDIHEDTIGRHTPLARLREAKGEIQRSLRSLEKSLKAARKTLAWDFTRIGSTAMTHQQLARQIGTELRDVQEIIADYEALVAEWQQPQKQKKKKKRSHAHAESIPRTTQQWMEFF